MKIISPAFEYGKRIPKKYTCQGIEISPPLLIEQVPEGTISLALLMEDPDVPKHLREDGLWVHWLVYNLSPEITSFKEGEAVQGQGILGWNTSEKTAYQGPCPPDREHRYFFYLYALSSNINSEEPLTREIFLSKVSSCTIEVAEYMGVYEQD